MSLWGRALIAGILALACLLGSVGLSAALGNAVPAGVGLLFGCALGLAAVFDAVAAVAVERTWPSVAGLLGTLATGGTAAALGLTVVTVIVIDASL